MLVLFTMKLYFAIYFLLIRSHYCGVLAKPGRPSKPGIQLHQRSSSLGAIRGISGTCWSKLRDSMFTASIGCFLAFSGTDSPARADENLDLDKVTAFVKLDVSIQRQPAREVDIGLFGEAAPESTRRFISFCSGDNDYKSAGQPFTYDGAQVSKISKDHEIEVGKFANGKSKKLTTKMSESGKVSLSSIDLGEDLTPTKDGAAGQLPIKKGLVTVPKKGGTFSFFIHSGALDDGVDAKSRVVIGEVINDEGLDVIETINSVPVSREDALGTKGAFSTVGKGFDPRAKLASVNRPLQRVEVLKCSVADKASLASFLKF